MIKLALFQTDLNVGGIQKSIVNLVNNLDKKKYSIDLFVNDAEDAFYRHQVSKEVNIIKLKRKSKIYESLPFKVFYKLFIKEYTNYYDKYEYDIAIDFNSYNNSCALGCLSVKSKQKYIWIHNDVELKRKNEIKYNILWNLMKSKYAMFDQCCAVSEGIVDSFRRQGVIPETQRIDVIPNFIDSGEIIEKSQETVDININTEIYNLVFVGRLSHQKGIDIMLQLMLEVLKKRQDIHLYIIGDGPSFEKATSYITKMRIDQYISLLGNQKNPYKYMNLMDGLILTSRYEGQGMVVREAQVLGLDIFITKNLEKYNEGVKSSENIIESIIHAEKPSKRINLLDDYNTKILNSLTKLLEVERDKNERHI